MTLPVVHSICSAVVNRPAQNTTDETAVANNRDAFNGDAFNSDAVAEPVPAFSESLQQSTDEAQKNLSEIALTLSTNAAALPLENSEIGTAEKTELTEAELLLQSTDAAAAEQEKAAEDVLTWLLKNPLSQPLKQPVSDASSQGFALQDRGETRSTGWLKTGGQGTPQALAAALQVQQNPAATLTKEQDAVMVNSDLAAIQSDTLAESPLLRTVAMAPVSNGDNAADPASGLRLAISQHIQNSAQPAADPEAKWGQLMLQSLHDQVQLQLTQQVQHATIRLDPPELGSLEISLTHESGRLTVQMNASQADVARMLHSISERLRQDLSGVQFSEVQVFTGRDEREQQRRQRGEQPAEEAVIGNALELAEDAAVDGSGARV